MFCPQCGTTQSAELRFCKSCGANLYAVRQAVASRETEEKVDWSKAWAQMFLSGPEIDRARGITPEIKRYNEIKDGIITTCVGAGASIFLFFLMQGIIMGGNVPPSKAAILSRVWLAGIIPLLIGLGLIFNGLFISKKIVEISKRDTSPGPPALEADAERPALQPADTAEFIPSGFSVTEGTTRHLESSERKS
ncbi:MAG TPA: zinc ribbon domain-containing protein [Pyrinomonadaceae bacterium]|nr:zinc ribbon domain-containing protein [Pyrinomonadaceae bacterium]